MKAAVVLILLSIVPASAQRFEVTCTTPNPADGWLAISTAPLTVPIHLRSITVFGHPPTADTDLWHWIADTTSPLGGWWEPVVQTNPVTKVAPNAPGCLYWKPVP